MHGHNIAVFHHCFEEVITYRASSSVTLMSFIECDSNLLDEEFSASSGFLVVKKPGCLGAGNEPSLPNIRTTDAMFGLSSGCCCTHKRAM